MGEGAKLQVDRVIARRFRLKRQLGSGGFGSVWLATDITGDQGDVALKLLHSKLRKKAQVSERFAREIHVLSELDHPNIARAIAWGADEDPAYLAMEHVQGVPLDRLMVEVATRGQLFSRLQIERLFGELCSAVGYAHSKNVVHRDLKPQNVMVAVRGEVLTVKVLDFGIARLLEESPTDRTTVGRMIGSPYYLAPEQIDSSGVDERSDIFSLGSILFELLTLKRCWLRDQAGFPVPVTEIGAAKLPQNSRVNALDRITRGPRPRPSDVVPGLSSAMDEPVLRALDVDPALRYANTEKLFAALKESLDRAASGAHREDHRSTLVDTPFEALENATLTTVMPVGFDMDHDTEPPNAYPDTKSDLAMPMIEPMPVDTGITPVIMSARTPNPPLMIEERVDVRTRDRTRFEAQRQRAKKMKLVQLGLIGLSLLLGAIVLVTRDKRVLPAIEATSVGAEQLPAVRARALAAKKEETVTSTPAADEPPKPAKAAPPPPPPPAKTRVVAAAPKPASPAEPVHASPHASLIAQLERARANPEERQLTFQVADRVAAEAAALPEPHAGAIQRCVTRSNMAGNIDQVIEILTGCIARLDQIAAAKP